MNATPPMNATAHFDNDGFAGECAVAIERVERASGALSAFTANPMSGKFSMGAGNDGSSEATQSIQSLQAGLRGPLLVLLQAFGDAPIQRRLCDDALLAAHSLSAQAERLTAQSLAPDEIALDVFS